MTEFHNYTLEEVAAQVGPLIEAGCEIHQKFTCANCHARQTMEEMNVLFTSGKCEECGHITNILETGCNFLLVTPKLGWKP